MPRLKRHEHDNYPTHKGLVKELLKHVDVQGKVLDPCTYDKDIINVLRKCNENVITFATDLRYSSEEDATKKEFWQPWINNIDWVVCNPPFNQAHLILPQALEAASEGVAFLLRSTYSEPCLNRWEFLDRESDRQRFKIEVSPRPKFRKDTKNTDSVSVAWFVWLKRFSWRGDLGVLPPFVYSRDWQVKNEDNSKENE